MELVKRTAHLTAVLGGFKKVDPFDKVFPSKKFRKSKSRDFKRFFGNLRGPENRKD